MVAGLCERDVLPWLSTPPGAVLIIVTDVAVSMWSECCLTMATTVQCVPRCTGLLSFHIVHCLLTMSGAEVGPLLDLLLWLFRLFVGKSPPP